MTHPDEQDLPAPLRDLDAELRQLRFEPRASLGPEIEGRWRAGERPPPPIGVVRGTLATLRRRPDLQRLVGVAATLAILTAFAARGLLGPAARAAVVDRCCVNLDGQTDADDGLVVETVGGDQVRRLFVYEDRDGDGRYSAGDQISFDRTGAPVLAPSAADGLTAQRFCCVDYDGGGPADDGLLVVNRPGGGIVLAAIYETPRAVTRGVPVLPPLR